MHLKKSYPMNPDTGVSGDHIELISIQPPTFDSTNGWGWGQLIFGVWLNTEARLTGKASLPISIYAPMPAAFFNGMVILPNPADTMFAIYNLKAYIPGLEDAEIMP